MMTTRPFSYLLTIAIVAHVASAQWWNPFGACSSLKGCRLKGNNRNGNYLKDKETISAGTYTMECDVDGDTLAYVNFEDNGGRLTNDFTPRYELGNIKLECDKTAKVQVMGRTWTADCFRREYTLDGSPCNTNTQCNYSCPTNSKKKKGIACPKDFQDCECNNGFGRNDGRGRCWKHRTCSGGYECPDNSGLRPNRNCANSFADCKCDRRFKTNENEDGCVSNCYECPPNSSDKRGCPKLFQHCECEPGYRRDSILEKCIDRCPNNFSCPSNSDRLPDVSCIRSFNDCSCKPGFKAVAGTCVANCPNYKCPINSSGVYGRTCIASFGDCNCRNGYVKDRYGRERCVQGVSAPTTRIDIPQPVPVPAPVPAPVPQPVPVPAPVPQPVPVPAPVPQPVPQPVPVPQAGPVSPIKRTPTKCEVQDLVDLMEEFVKEEKALLAQWLRLSFHDAGTFNQDTMEGGANGCLLTDERMRMQMENNFLDLALDPLESIWDLWERRASAADIIQFAGFYAVVRQKDSTQGLSTRKRRELEDFEWGRPDETECQISWADNLPGFELGTEPLGDVPKRCIMAGKEIKKKMMDRNGFTAREATALIGAHTIGLTRNVFDDLAGPWVLNGRDDATEEGPVFDNGFHGFLINSVQRNPDRTFQDFAEDRTPFDEDFPTWFRQNGVELNHLDTDIALAFEAPLNRNNAREHPNFHQFTEQFANDNQLFMRIFLRSFRKMSQLGVNTIASPLSASTGASCAARVQVEIGRINGDNAAGPFNTVVGGGLSVEAEREAALTKAEAGLRETARQPEQAAQTTFLTTPINIP